MLKPNRVLHIKNIIVEIVIVISTCIFAMVLANLDTKGALFPTALAEQGLRIEYSIYTKSV
jgi:hypothetical protein